MTQFIQSSDFLDYLLLKCDEKDPGKIPSLQKLSKELKISVSILREQLEVAKALGFVEVKPRTGIRRLPYSFYPAIARSLSYAIEMDHLNFLYFAELRNVLEEAYWHQAVKLLDAQDLVFLQNLIEKAFEKLNGTPIQIPHSEHRQLHMKLYEHLDNPFVFGILEAFWEAYEAVGFNVYADYDYLQNVWNYHMQMIEALFDGDIEAGFQALVSHKDLLQNRVSSINESTT